MRIDLMKGPFGRVMAANFFFFLNFAAFFLLPLYVRSLGGSEGTIGIAMGITGLASMLSLPFLGRLIDRLGRRRFLALGSLGMSLASASFIFIHELGPMLFVLRALQGISFAAAFTASTTMAADFAPLEQRGQALGLFGVSTLLTHALSPMIGEQIIASFGFHALFLTAASFSLVAVVLARTIPVHEPADIPTAGVATSLSQLHWIVAATMALQGMGFGCVMTFIPTFVRVMDLGRASYFFGAYTSTAIGTRLIGASLSDRVGRRRVVIPALLVLSLSIFGLADATNVAALAAAGAAFGIAQGISYPTLHAYMVDISTKPQFGRAQALFNGAFNLGVMSSAFVFGQVADHFGHRVMFGVAGFTPTLAALVFWRLVPGDRVHAVVVATEA